MSTRTVRSGVDRNAHAKPRAAYGWIGKQRFEPEDYGPTFARTRRAPPDLRSAASGLPVTLCGGKSDENGHPGPPLELRLG